MSGLDGNSDDGRRRNKVQVQVGATDPNISLEHTISTIHSLPDDHDDHDDEPMHNLSFDVHEQKKERKRRKLQKSNNNNNNDSSESKSKSKRSKSILHTYPMNQTSASATESSKRLIKALKEIYQKDVLPLEQKFNLYNFCLPTNAEIQDSEFDAKPMVLMLGQYSTGKTTFIRHLIGRDFPAMHIGPEPTTDRFMALVHGSDEGEYDDDDDDDGYDELNDSIFDDHGHGHGRDHDDLNSTSSRSSERNAKIPTKAWKNDGRNKSTGQVLKGNSLTVMPELPFSTLATFGSGFLGHFVGSVSSAPLLQHVTLIDTPGVLSGEKQRLSRSYDFAEAAKWFADRSDLILLLFDAHKLDISDELKDVIETIRPNNDDKMRCVLNKADAVTREQLVRVYGSLMWSMGKIFRSPEVVRVFTGSYWDEKLVHDDFKSMFESDEWLLINELVNLPKSCAERKVNEVVKRIRIIKVHICIMTYLKKKTPTWFGKKKAMENMIENLEDVFDAVRVEYKLSVGDFPDVDEFARCLEDVDDFSDLVAADKKTLRRLDELIIKDIPAIMKGAAGLSGPDTPVRKQKPVSDSPGRKQKVSQTIIQEGDDDGDQNLNKSPSSGSLASMASMSSQTKETPSSSSPYMFMMIIIFVGLYMLLYMIVEQNLYRTIPIPVSIVRHFLRVQNFVRNHVFDDSIPSDDSLV